MNVISEEGKAPIKMWTDGVQVESQARQQLLNTASLPFIYKHIAVMPDVHLGRGATIGSVIPTRGAIIPAAVGVDIGCGMSYTGTLLTASDLPDSLARLRSRIEAAVPAGRTMNGGPGDIGAWGDAVPIHVQKTWAALEPYYRGILLNHPGVESRGNNRECHLGTLGTGNHFIEITLDENDHVGILLHSGSRGVGNAIGRYFIELAKKDMRQWFINLPDADLAYIPEGTDHFRAYYDAVEWAQEYAKLNRQIMMDAVMRVLDDELWPLSHLTEIDSFTDCHHNYVNRENHFGANVLVTRKGAIRARKGDIGIIPGSMGARSYIVRGLGNPQSFNSCSHGAGRAMSRTEARKTFTVTDLVQQTEGVECIKDASVLEEVPCAYKPIEAVMAAQSDLVEIVHTLRQVLCVKGRDDKVEE